MRDFKSRVSCTPATNVLICIAQIVRGDNHCMRKRSAIKHIRHNLIFVNLCNNNINKLLYSRILLHLIRIGKLPRYKYILGSA